MSLGVLNNLSAVYAENSLNNTNNSLNTVLQQLSSGSKINSGADDAAGLSLVDGLQANQQALTQSQTNATEGVGLLQVADGALSQVTSLLNRAVTLATEASNGTLNATQDSAANQEYQSILSEIDNIGSTTTYNQEQVFGSNTNIYTGDSSTEGASIDDLNIRTLSASNVGDTGGVMAYSSGQSSVFLNLSSSTQNAQSTDTLNANGSSTINVNYLVPGANGSSTPASTSITVGTGTDYANTADGLISAIDDAGLGLSANFTTQSQAGVAGGGNETGIQITGGLISVGVDPSTSATSGTLDPSEITSSQLTIGQTVTVKVGSATAASVTLDQSDNTLAGLAAAINSGTGGTGGVTANVVYNSAGQATSLQLADSASAGGAISVTTSASNVNPNSSVTFTAGQTGQAGVLGSASLGISGAGSNGSSQVLSGSITLSNGTTTQTYVMGTGASNSYDAETGTMTLSSANSTLAGLAAAMSGSVGNGGIGAAAVASASGIAITSTAPGTGITEGASTLTAALSAGATTNVAGLAASAGTDGSTVISMTGDGMGIAGATTLTSGTAITLQNGTGTAVTLTMGTNAGDVIGANGNTASAITTAGLTAQDLVTAINDNTSQLGMSAAIQNGNIVVSSTAVGTSIVASANNLAGTQSLTASTNTAVDPAANVYSTVNVLTGTSNPAVGSLTTTGDTLSGSMTITNNGVTDTFTIGAGTNTANSFFTGTGQTSLADLESTITGAANLGVTASNDSAGQGMTLTANAYGTTISTGGTGITDTSTVGTDAQGTLGGAGQVLTSTLSADDNGVLSSTAGLAGTFIIGETGSGVNTGTASTLTVVVGAAAVGQTSTATTLYIPGNNTSATMTQIAGAINTFVSSVTNTGGDNFDITASVDANTGGLTIQAGADTGTDSALGITADGGSFATVQNLTAGSVTDGSVSGEATVTVGNGSGTIDANSINDALANGGTITIENTAGSESTDGNQTVTFTLGNSGTQSGNGTNAVTTAADTMSSLMDAINSQTGMNLSATIVNGALQIQSTALGSGLATGDITVSSTTGLAQAYGVGNIGGANSGVVVNAGSGPSSATSAAVSINTTQGMSTSGNDALAGQVILTNSSNGTAVTFNLNDSTASSGNTVNLTGADSTVNGLVAAINSNATLGITASVNSTTGALQLQANATDTSIGVGGTGLTDATAEVLTAGTVAQAAVDSTGTINLASGNFSGADALGGSLSVTANGNTMNYVMGSGASNIVSGSTVTLSAANSTVNGLEQALNTYSGLTATTSGGTMTLTSDTANADAINVSGNLYDSSASLSYTAGGAYSVGISNNASTGVYDSATQSAPSAGPGAASANLTASDSGSSGIATISYSDGAGVSLSTTDLSNQTDAETALTALNSAISDVAAQDGYIGAQINTLNSVSQVLSTQSENVESAQNAVQATDYAAATSNMSKYEILSQTGIAALAQANSMQQEVTKLLQ